MVAERNVVESYTLTKFQKESIKELFKDDIKVIDHFLDGDRDLVLIIQDDEFVIEHFIICPQEDVFFCAIGKKDPFMDQYIRIN